MVRAGECGMIFRKKQRLAARYSVCIRLDEEKHGNLIHDYPCSGRDSNITPLEYIH
jgi:hypothetical protein